MEIGERRIFSISRDNTGYCCEVADDNCITTSDIARGGFHNVADVLYFVITYLMDTFRQK